MKRPICDFVDKYIESDACRFHMPGHKGKGELLEARDITEIKGADSLFEADGVILESEKYASELFGAHTFYSTEGSSHTIRAMLYLVSLYAKSRGEKPIILAARNAHKAFLSGIIMLDIELEWIFPSPEESYLSMELSPDDLDMILTAAPEKPTAVYITSPDYLGAVSDVRGLSEVCREHGVLLIVDNAHGAYLKFLPEDIHPITLGADICCDSAHKTLPVLTGGAYLHIARGLEGIFDFKAYAKEALALFGSTSPSYLILQSLDAVNDSLLGEYKDRLSELSARLSSMKMRLSEHGYDVVFGADVLKLTLKTASFGYFGSELADILRESNIECEFADRDNLVLMVTPSNTDDQLEKLEKALLSVKKRESVSTSAYEVPGVCLPNYAMSAREAALMPYEILPLEKCIGRVCAFQSVSCPPAVPIVVAGEVIDEAVADTLKYYGYIECKVIKA